MAKRIFTPPEGKPSSRTAAPAEQKLPLLDAANWGYKIGTGDIKKRLQAIENAGKTRDPHAIAALIEAFEESEPEIQEKLKETLESIGLPHVASLRIEALKNGSIIERNMAAMDLAIIGSEFKDVGLKEALLMPALRDALADNDPDFHETLVKALGELGDSSVFPELVQMVNDGNDAVHGIAGCGHPSAVPALIDALENRNLEIVCSAVYHLGKSWDKRAIKPLVGLLGGDLSLENLVVEALRELGLTDAKILDARKKMEASREQASSGSIEKDPESLLGLPCQKEAYRLIASRRDMKRRVFENAESLKILQNPQAWMTVNDPQLAKEALRVVLGKAGSGRQSALDNALVRALGTRSGALEEAHFTYYADEILDAIAMYAQNSRLKDDPDVHDVLSRVRFGSNIRLRYISRVKEDLSLGDKCGDCTAKGSINYGNSVMWLVNPAYQILKMSKGGTFIGRVNFTIGSVAGKDALIIDALEFNPQAQEGMPLEGDARTCFDHAISFLKELARQEGRELYAIAFSNSEGASEILHSTGRSLASISSKPTIKISLIMSSEDLKRILPASEGSHDISLFYQMLDGDGAAARIGLSATSRVDIADSLLPTLERDVINPGQMAYPDIAEPMRARDFDNASKAILSKPELAKRIKEIFRFPENAAVSPKFVSTRLLKIYDTDAASIEKLRKGFFVRADKFVRL